MQSYLAVFSNSHFINVILQCLCELQLYYQMRFYCVENVLLIPMLRLLYNIDWGGLSMVQFHLHFHAKKPTLYPSTTIVKVYVMALMKTLIWFFDGLLHIINFIFVINMLPKPNSSFKLFFQHQFQQQTH